MIMLMFFQTFKWKDCYIFYKRRKKRITKETHINICQHINTYLTMVAVDIDGQYPMDLLPLPLHVPLKLRSVKCSSVRIIEKKNSYSSFFTLKRLMLCVSYTAKIVPLLYISSNTSIARLSLKNRRGIFWPSVQRLQTCINMLTMTSNGIGEIHFY